jgi:hypothetical protein
METFTFRMMKIKTKLDLLSSFYQIKHSVAQQIYFDQIHQNNCNAMK